MVASAVCLHAGKRQWPQGWSRTWPDLSGPERVRYLRWALHSASHIVDDALGDGSYGGLVKGTCEEGSKGAAKEDGPFACGAAYGNAHHVLLSNVALDEVVWVLIFKEAR